MVLIIGGHQRSGTTLLRRICDHHPNIKIAKEFRNFAYINRPYILYCLFMLGRWWQVQNRPFDSVFAKSSRIRLHNLIFLIYYLLKMRSHWKEKVGLSAIETGLHGVFPGSYIVGDKYPDYVYSLDKLTGLHGLRCLIIYRDCRDVTSSTLKMARTKWRKDKFSKALDMAEKVARRWVLAIEQMEKYAEKIYTIRYEDLVQTPESEMKGLGGWLNVNPDAFPIRRIRDTSIGKYKYGLTDKELEIVMEIAGPTMDRLGYV